MTAMETHPTMAFRHPFTSSLLPVNCGGTAPEGAGYGSARQGMHGKEKRDSTKQWLKLKRFRSVALSSLMTIGNFSQMN